MYFGSPESYEWYGKDCLLYVRVSTEEQVRKGYSLDAQLEELEAFAYIALTGRKILLRELELQFGK